MKFLLRKFYTELLCTYNHEHTYYHRPYNHIIAYTKYQNYWLIGLELTNSYWMSLKQSFKSLNRGEN